MTQEEKSLLLKNLCARLPYYPKCKMIDELRVVNNEKDSSYISTLFPKHIELFSYHNNFIIKPYLRSMSSITKEEISDLQKINSQFCFDRFDNFAYVGAADDGFCSVEEMDKILNYLNSKHLDYLGFISMDLALEAPDDMYK